MKKMIGLAIASLLVAGFAGTAMAGSDYYEFSTYSGSGSEYDVACFGDTIYYGSGASVYSVDVSIADMTKVDEPKFQADGVTPNPNYQARTFSNNQAITLQPPPGTYLNWGGAGEMYVDTNYIYTTTSANQVMAFDKSSGAYVSTVVTGGTMPNYDGAHFLSYGDGKWWTGDESRNIYSSTGGTWNYEFTFSSLAGGHGDGMEVVNGGVYVSDMTSNYIALWTEDSNGVWSEQKRFAYTEIGGVNKYLEGMGFGALGHFWAGSGSQIYELGGGTLGDYTNNDVPEPATMLLFGTGLAGLAGMRRRKAVKK